MSHIFNIDPIDIKLLVSVKCEVLLLDLLQQKITTFFDDATAIGSKTSMSYDGMCESYYGITWNSKNETVYVVGSELGAPDGRRLKTKICRLTPSGDFIDFIPIKNHVRFSAAHQIQYHNGFIFVADTIGNCIRKIDPNTGDGQTLKIYENRFGNDFDHVNSVWVDDYIYVLSNGTTGNTKPMVHRFRYNDCSKVDSVTQGIAGAHNIAKLWGKRVVLASYKGDLVDEENKTLIHIGDFVRGLSITPDYIFVGQSVIADRDQRLNTNHGCVSVHDSKDGKFIGNIKLANVGQIHEIRCINQDDTAHSQDRLL
jgi:hypothetical protein